MDPRDKTMLDAAVHGDARAIEALLVEHLPHLQRYLGRNVGRLVAGKESLSDLVQSVCREALERAQDGRLELRGEGEFVQWLYKAAMMKILNRHRYWSAGRRDAGEVPIGEDRTEGGDGVPVAGQDPTPSEGAIHHEELDAFARAFGQLDAEQQAVLILAHVEGLPHEEIGERLGVSAAHSRTKLSRALARLAKLATRK